MKRETLQYGTVEFLHHMDQSLADAVNWHSANHHFRNDREQSAYEAGFQQGHRDALNALKLHAGIALRDKLADADAHLA